MAIEIFERMLNYLPPYWHKFLETRELLNAEAIEFKRLDESSQKILTDAFFDTMSESRTAEWEKWLKIPPTGTLEERRQTVAQYFGTIAKFNEQMIKILVAQLHNDARAFVQFKDGYFKITVVPLPAHFMDELDFTQLIKQLNTRKPCHLMLDVERGYSDWGDIAENHESWATVKNKFRSWEEVLMYIPR